MRERLHLKKCKMEGRTQPKITHAEVEQKCYNGLSRRQNALYKNFKFDDGVDTRTKVPAHMEQARMLEHIINQVWEQMSPDQTLNIGDEINQDRMLGCVQAYKNPRKNKKEQRRKFATAARQAFQQVIDGEEEEVKIPVRLIDRSIIKHPQKK